MVSRRTAGGYNGEGAPASAREADIPLSAPRFRHRKAQPCVLLANRSSQECLLGLLPSSRANTLASGRVAFGSADWDSALFADTKTRTVCRGSRRLGHRRRRSNNNSPNRATSFGPPIRCGKRSKASRRPAMWPS